MIANEPIRLNRIVLDGIRKQVKAGVAVKEIQYDSPFIKYLIEDEMGVHVHTTDDATEYIFRRNVIAPPALDL